MTYFLYFQRVSVVCSCVSVLNILINDFSLLRVLVNNL